MNVFTKITNALQGRTTAALMGFFVAGNVLQLLHRLDATYIAFMATLMSFVLGHSIKEDVFAPPAQSGQANAAPGPEARP